MPPETAPDANELSGAQCAAVLLLSLGEQDAAMVLKHMDARDVQTMGSTMAAMKTVNRDQVTMVLDRFQQELTQQTSIGVGTDEYVRRVLISALGKHKAGGLIDRILLGRGSKGLESLKWMESRAIADLVGQEHPQIIALVLAHLEPHQAAEVLGYLPEATRSGVVMRIATLDRVQPHALQELDEVMERQFSGASDKLKSARVGGLKAAADILNSMESAHETALIGEIKGADDGLGTRIEELMFTFEDLTQIDDRGMQTLLREVPTPRLVVALKGSDASLREHFFANMSQRAAEMLRDDLEVSSPVRLSDVDAAQKEILAIARKLADEGKLVLGGSEELV